MAPTHVETIKSTLLHFNWPIVISIQVTNSFVYMWYNGGIWTSNDANSNLGGHSVCIVGYGDDKLSTVKRECLNAKTNGVQQKAIMDIFG